MPLDNWSPHYLKLQFCGLNNVQLKELSDKYIEYYKNCSEFYGELARKEIEESNKNAVKKK